MQMRSYFRLKKSVVMLGEKGTGCDNCQRVKVTHLCNYMGDSQYERWLCESSEGAQ